MNGEITPDNWNDDHLISGNLPLSQLDKVPSQTVLGNVSGGLGPATALTGQQLASMMGSAGIGIAATGILQQDLALTSTDFVDVCSVSLPNTSATYFISGRLYVVGGASDGGIQVAISGTPIVGAPGGIAAGWFMGSAAPVIGLEAINFTAPPMLLTDGISLSEGGYVSVEATIPITTSGTITIQAAQFRANANPTTLNLGSMIMAFALPGLAS